MLTRTFVTTSVALLLLTAAARGQERQPTFSHPTKITNPFAPFRPDSVKIFHGRSEGDQTVTLERHLEQTRVFVYAGAAVETRIIEEKEFENGELVEITTHYVAQDDRGNVAYFGEVARNYEHGAIVGIEEDSWLVGGASEAGDPEGVYAADKPTTYMVAHPQVGQSFSQENFPDSDEILTVVAVGETVRVPSGKYVRAVKLMETSELEPEPPQFRWIVPGVGVVKEAARESRSRLVATSLRQQGIHHGEN